VKIENFKFQKKKILALQKKYFFHEINGKNKFGGQDGLTIWLVPE
jgi:hypothetical protein